jgi:hypothetical protein
MKSNLKHMRTNVQKLLTRFLLFFFIGSSVFFLTDCKGHVDIDDITDSVQNCSPPFVVNFYPQASYGTRKLEFTWDFGDGSPFSHEKEPVHIYTENGRFTVTLTIRQKEAMETKSFYLYLTPDSTAPYADWDYASRADSLWAPAYVEFQNYSLHSPNQLWQFGDGETSIDRNPIHIFDTPGTYTTRLNAICNTDTSKYQRQMVIKPAPGDILIDQVTVWMPSQFLGTNISVEIYYAGHREGESVTANGVSSFPITFTFNPLNLTYFNGIFDSSKLEFLVWSSYNPDYPSRIFEVESRDLQLEYYPNVIGYDDGFGFKYEAGLIYRD